MIPCAFELHILQCICGVEEYATRDATMLQAEQWKGRAKVAAINICHRR